MKIRTTRKEILSSSANLKCAGYCELQTLLRNHNPVAYNSGKYGWNFDVYEIYGVTICTGYRGMPGERIKAAKEYEEAARTVLYDRSLSYEQASEAVEKLLKKFCLENGGIA